MKLVIIWIVLIVSSLGCTKDKDPIAPEEKYTLLSQLDLPAFKNDLWGYEIGEEEFALIASSDSNDAGQVSIVNITDPMQPTLVSTINKSAVDIKVWENYIYIVGGSNTDVSDQLTGLIYDLKNPNEPKMVGTIPEFHNIFIDELGYLYVTGYFPNINISGSVGLDVSIFDLNSTPESPELISSIPSNSEFIIPAHDIFVKNDRLYIFSTSGSYVEIVDVQNKNTPLSIGKYSFDNNENVHSGWVSTDNNYLFVCLEEADVKDLDIAILDISDLSSIYLAGGIEDVKNVVHNAYVIDDYLYTAFYNAGFRLYDISHPTEPEIIYEFDTNTLETHNSIWVGAFGIYPFFSSGIVAVSDIKNGLFLFAPNVP